MSSSKAASVPLQKDNPAGRRWDRLMGEPPPPILPGFLCQIPEQARIVSEDADRHRGLHKPSRGCMPLSPCTRKPLLGLPNYLGCCCCQAAFFYSCVVLLLANAAACRCWRHSCQIHPNILAWRQGGMLMWKFKEPLGFKAEF